MNDLARLDARSFHSRLGDLLRIETVALGAFLQALAQFDRRRLFRQLGHASLFDYLHKGLGLSRAAAHHRRAAAGLIQLFPEALAHIEQGRLCFTTAAIVASVITEDNRADVLPRFFGLSKQEALEVAAELKPRAVVPKRTVVTSQPPCDPRPTGVEAGMQPTFTLAPGVMAPASSAMLPATSPLNTKPSAPWTDPCQKVRLGELDIPRRRVEPLTATESRLHITVSREFLALLKKAKAGESHRNPGATDEEVLKLALEALIEKQSKRKASVPARVKREVVARDDGKCQWPLPDGSICGATARLEIDHVVPRGMGGPSTVDNCRILCKGHNLEAARQAYGDEVMDLFTRPGVAREPAVEYLPGAPPLAAGTTVPPRRVTARIETRFTDRVGFPAGRWRGREAAPRTGRSGRRGACRGARDGLAPPPGTGPVAA